MKILVFTGYYLPGFKGGGPVRSIEAFADMLSDAGHIIDIVTSDRDLGDLNPYSDVDISNWNNVGGAKVFYIPKGIKGYWYILEILRTSSYDVLYLNGFFIFKFTIFPILFAYLFNIPTLVAPRGELSRGALSLKSMKKNTYLSIFKLFGLNKIISFQASSDLEKSEILSNLGEDSRVYICENMKKQELIPPVFRCRNNRPLKVIFISRITPKKNLLACFEILREVNVDIDFHIYGPIEDRNYWEKCQVAASNLPSNVRYRYSGMIEPENVVKIMSCYDLFLFPTLGENYGHVVVEAFCAGLPVLISDTTPWINLSEKDIGWDVSLSDTALFASIINSYSTLNEVDQFKKRQRVFEWAKLRFNKEISIHKNVEMFAMLINFYGKKDEV